MSVWPQVRVRYRRVHPWPCLRCANLGWATTVCREHGATNDECTAPGHNYLLLASLDERDCDDFTPREKQIKVGDKVLMKIALGLVKSMPHSEFSDTN